MNPYARWATKKYRTLARSGRTATRALGTTYTAADIEELRAQVDPELKRLSDHPGRREYIWRTLSPEMKIDYLTSSMLQDDRTLERVRTRPELKHYQPGTIPDTRHMDVIEPWFLTADQFERRAEREVSIATIPVHNLRMTRTQTGILVALDYARRRRSAPQPPPRREEILMDQQRRVLERG